MIPMVPLKVNHFYLYFSFVPKSDIIKRKWRVRQKIGCFEHKMSSWVKEQGENFYIYKGDAAR
ncbi:hypothetical protein JCM15765_20600 [Paradesulfitobacterium aromaticivorans]